MNPIPGDASVIHIGHRATSLRGGPQGDAVIAIGAGEIADTVFRHSPPSALEIDQAIDRVEDALTASGLRHGERGDVVIDDPQLHAVLELGGARLRASRDEVERLFAELASATPGRIAFGDDGLAGRDAAARLLILRECLHHLGYQGVRHTAPPVR